MKYHVTLAGFMMEKLCMLGLIFQIWFVKKKSNLQGEAKAHFQTLI